jgi:hypothetical protein
MSILNEADRIKQIMGVDETPKMNVNLKNVVQTLEFLKLYNTSIEKMLIDLSNLAKEQIIDFNMLERGLRKMLLKKGDKNKNVKEYFGKVINMCSMLYDFLHRYSKGSTINRTLSSTP